MALSRIKTDMIVDDAISSAKIDDDTIVAADVVAGQIMNVKISSGAGDKIAHTKTTVGTAATLNVGGASNAVQLDATPKLPVLSGTNLTNLSAGNLVGALPVMNGSALTSLTSNNLTGGFPTSPALNGSALTSLTSNNLIGSFPTSPAISGANLTGIVTDFTPITNSMARLGLHLGAVEQLAKYNMIDQVIDDYEDATGVTAENSVAAVPAIPYSCRFTRASSDDMSKASLSGGSTTKGTQSWWFKRASISSDQRMWANYSGSSTARNQVGWQATNKLYIQWAGTTVRISTQTFTSTTAWVHIVVAWDSTQATAADRLRVYIDGSEITAWDTNAAPTQNADMYLNNGKVYLGRRETSSLYLDAHMADFRSVDGQQLTPSTFGQTVSGVWKPKTVTGLTYGTNGFYLDFADNNALGNDVSGNNKDFTVANLTSGDRSTDTPQPSAVAAESNTGSSTSATLAGSAGAKYYSGANSNQTLISTTTTALTAPTKASIVLQTEDATGTSTINTDVKAGVSRDALNYVDTTLAKIGTWGSGNVYAANDVTMPGTVMTQAVTVRSSAGANKFHIDEVITPATAGAYVTGDRSSSITVTMAGMTVGNAAITTLVDGSISYPSGIFYYNVSTPATDGSAYIRFQFSTTRVITEAKYRTSTGGYPTGTWRWQASNDASSWTNIGNTFVLATGAADQLHTELNGNTTSYLYYQMTFVSGSLNSSEFQLEIEFKEGYVAASYSNQQPILTATEGYTYKFDTSDSTMSGHTFKFATAADAAGSTQYTTGVTESGTPGSANAYTQIVVAASAPTLYYYCSNHASMGGQADTPAEFLPLGKGAMRYRVDTKNQSYTAAGGAYQDSSSSAHTVIAVGTAAISTTQTKIGTHSMVFDAGATDFHTSASSDFAFGTGDFTAECWIYPQNTTGDPMIMGNTYAPYSASTTFWRLYINHASTKLKYGNSSAVLLTSATSISNSTWTHIAVTRQSGTTRMYLNGVQDATVSDTGNLSGVREFFLGDGMDGTTWLGYMDEVRVSDNCRYPDGTTFTPSTSAFTSDANTKLLIHGESLAASGKVTRIHGTSLAWS